MKRLTGGVLAGLCATVLLCGCSFSNSYFLVGHGTQRQELSAMLAGIASNRSSEETRFVYITQIAKALRANGDLSKLNLFLTDYVQKHQNDPYDGYYLFMVAQNYERQSALPFAIHYYDRVVQSYPDLLVHGVSIHFSSLSRLIKLTKDPEQRVGYYRDLIARFSDRIQKGPIYYFLGKAYGELGEWDLQMQAYKAYLNSPDESIPGYPDARREVSNIIDFYDYPNKDWTMPNLADLVNAIRSAINTQNVNRLAKYRAKVGFFARSWESDAMPVDPEFLADFGVFLNPSVWMSDTLDVDSNSKEAYLRTGGWTYRIETWYLYFKKINFPADPDVQGQWEWAGIYFGEKPFSGAVSSN